MKKTALALIITLLVSAMAGVFVVRLGKANPNPFFITGSDAPPLVSLDSPLNRTYNGKVLLNFTISAPRNWYYTEKVSTVEYSVDWKHCETFILNSNLSEPFSYSTVLENLTDGNHVLRIFVDSTGWFYQQFSNTETFPQIVTSAMANFALDTVSPAIQILSLENKTYYESDLQLNFTVSENFYNSSYVLDGQYVPVTQNSTLSDLSAGSHNLTIYAYDFAGNIGASETIFFSVAESFPTTLVITSVSIVAVVGIGLLVYFKKFHRDKSP